jgi:hypothetical protein
MALWKTVGRKKNSNSKHAFINEDTTRAIYFARRNRQPDSLLKLNGWNIPFVNSVKYLGVLFDKRMTWRLRMQMIEAKTFRTCGRGSQMGA